MDRMEAQLDGEGGGGGVEMEMDWLGVWELIEVNGDVVVGAGWAGDKRMRHVWEVVNIYVYFIDVFASMGLVRWRNNM